MQLLALLVDVEDDDDDVDELVLDDVEVEDVSFDQDAAHLSITCT